MMIRKILISIYKKIVKIFSGYGLGKKFYPIKFINNFILSILKSNFVEVEGNKMFLDSRDSLNLSIYNIYEPFETEICKRFVKNSNIVLDLGANIGYYTLIFARLLKEKGKVYAFEPDPDNFSLLQRNVEVNDYKNVILEQKAVTNKTGKIKLYLCEDNPGDHRIYNSHDGRRSIEIQAVKLDDYFKNYEGKIDFIKMDVQGAEGGVIQGMPELLKKNKNIKIITEFWPLGLKTFGIEPEEYLELLISHGFKLYHINKYKKKLEPVNIIELLKMYTPDKMNATNLLCLK